MTNTSKHPDSFCCDCGQDLYPDQRYLINGGALCDKCLIAREDESMPHITVEQANSEVAAMVAEAAKNG